MKSGPPNHLGYTGLGLPPEDGLKEARETLRRNLARLDAELEGRGDAPPKKNYSTAQGQKELMAISTGLPSDTYTRKVDLNKPGDYGADPLGDGKFKMIPSGDIVDLEERNRRLKKK